MMQSAILTIAVFVATSALPTGTDSPPSGATMESSLAHLGDALFEQSGAVQCLQQQCASSYAACLADPVCKGVMHCVSPCSKGDSSCALDCVKPHFLEHKVAALGACGGTKGCWTQQAPPAPNRTALSGGVGGHQPALLFNESDYSARLSRWSDLMNGTQSAAAAMDSFATCSRDMRSKMPACTQFGNMWCWATGVAALTEYYTASGPAQCKGLECEVVSWCPTPEGSGCSAPKQCCPFQQHPECGNYGQTPANVATAATHFTGKPHAEYGGPMPQKVLDAHLQAGKPILLLSKGHVMSVRGCGGGRYYFWDPEWSKAHGGVYPQGSDVRTYSELLSYTYPSGYTVKWVGTIYGK